MNVALSFIICFRSSPRSVTIQSSLRGSIAVSRDITDLFCKRRQSRSTDVNQRTLLTETENNMSLAL